MSLSPPMLAILDLADGSGVTATIAAGDPAAGNVLMRLPVSGETAPTIWESVATITGNDTSSVIPGVGHYWWVVLSTVGGATVVSNIVYQPATDGAASLQDRIWDAVIARLQMLNLTDIGTRIYKRIIPQEGVAMFPCGVCTLLSEQESMRGGLTGRDDVGYPVSIWFCDTNGLGPNAPISKYTKWRQSAMRALRNQRLPGVIEVYTCELEPKAIVDTKAPEYQKFVTGFTARFLARERRGFGA